MLRKINSKGIWPRTEAEITAETEYILDILDSHQKLADGFSALRALQIEKANALTYGKPASIRPSAPHPIRRGGL